MIEFRKTPIYQTELRRVSEKGISKPKQSNLAFFMIYHDIMRFDISMHDALAMAKV